MADLHKPVVRVLGDVALKLCSQVGDLFAILLDVLLLEVDAVARPITNNGMGDKAIERHPYVR